MFGGPEPLHRYNYCKHWSLLRSEPLQRRYRGVTGRYKWKRGPSFVKSTMEGGDAEAETPEGREYLRPQGAVFKRDKRDKRDKSIKTGFFAFWKRDK